MPHRIEPARVEDDFRAAADLFRAYVASLDLDLAYQDFEAELAALPGKYAPPRGELLVARDEESCPIGCVALRHLTEGVAEIKRLYVAPEGRGRGLGKALVDAVLREARGKGYREVRLDTLPAMKAAIALYRAAGFTEIPPYYTTPTDENLFFALRLETSP